MTYYLLIIALCSIGYIIPFKNDKEMGYILLGLLAIFLSSGYMCGTDWPNYEIMYQTANLSLIDGFSKEKGFFIYMLFFKSLGIDFWSFIIISKLIVFYILIVFLKEFDIKKSGFLLLFLTEIGVMLFIDNPLRNFIAFGISLIAVKFLINSNNWGFFILSLTAISFHYSAIILFTFYFVRNINFKTDFTLITYFLIYIICLNFDFSFLKYIMPSELYTSRVGVYLVNSQFINNSFNLGFIYRTLTFLFIIFYKDEIIKKKYGKMVFNLSIIFFLIYPLSLGFVIIQRLQYYSFPFYIIAVLYAIKSIDRIIYKEITVILFIAYSFIKLNSVLTQDSRYIPYSNYFYYEITDTKPDYKTRSNYNERNSPYEKPKGSW